MKVKFAAISKDNETLEIRTGITGNYYLMIDGNVVYQSFTAKAVEKRARAFMQADRAKGWQIVVNKLG